MLNRFYYLQTDPAADECGRKAAQDADIPIVHLPNNNHTLLTHQYSSKGNYPFCLALQDLADDDDPLQTLRELLLLLFHPYYQWGEQGKPLFIFPPLQKTAAENEPPEKAPPEKEPLEKTLTFRQRTQEFFAAQGLQVELISVGSSVHLLETTENDPAGDYYRYCIDRWSPDDIFLLKGPHPEKVIEDLQAVTDDLQLEHPVFSKLASENTQFRQQLALLDRDNLRLKEENAILGELTELNSRHNEVDYILRFYKNEYEILPLWYKRLGHIIKVLQGKRSFRSLYDKNVKKYKD